jgi:hypothetical protein
MSVAIPRVQTRSMSRGRKSKPSEAEVVLPRGVVPCPPFNFPQPHGDPTTVVAGPHGDSTHVNCIHMYAKMVAHIENELRQVVPMHSFKLLGGARSWLDRFSNENGVVDLFGVAVSLLWGALPADHPGLCEQLHQLLLVVKKSEMGVFQPRAGLIERHRANMMRLDMLVRPLSYAALLEQAQRVAQDDIAVEEMMSSLGAVIDRLATGALAACNADFAKAPSQEAYEDALTDAREMRRFADDMGTVNARQRAAVLGLRHLVTVSGNKAAAEVIELMWEYKAFTVRVVQPTDAQMLYSPSTPRGGWLLPERVWMFTE